MSILTLAIIGNIFSIISSQVMGLVALLQLPYLSGHNSQSLEALL